jgi:hypothetical protein
MFRLDPLADTGGTCFVDSVYVPPAFLVQRFGPPGRGTDDGKVSGCYRFTNAAGEVFTLYDWKVTALYHGEENDWPTRDEFWAIPEPVELNIGGSGEENEDGLNLTATAFREWLLKQYRGYQSGLVN